MPTFRISTQCAFCTKTKHRYQHIRARDYAEDTGTDWCAVSQAERTEIFAATRIYLNRKSICCPTCLKISLGKHISDYKKPEWNDFLEWKHFDSVIGEPWFRRFLGRINALHRLPGIIEQHEKTIKKLQDNCKTQYDYHKPGSHVQIDWNCARSVHLLQKKQNQSYHKYAKESECGYKHKILQSFSGKPHEQPDHQKWCEENHHLHSDMFAQRHDDSEQQQEHKAFVGEDDDDECEFPEEDDVPPRLPRNRKVHTNKHMNRVSYHKLSNWDCYQLTGNTRKQIRIMAKETHVVEEIMFYFWHRMYTYTSFSRQAVLFGMSASSLTRWFRFVLKRMKLWAKQRLLNAKQEEHDQYWSTARILKESTRLAQELHDPHNEGYPCVAADGTYAYHQQIQTDHNLRQGTYSVYKGQVLCKPHIMSSMNGKIIDLKTFLGRAGTNSDTNIWRALYDPAYLHWCKEHPGHQNRILSDDDIKEGLYFWKIWGCQGGRALVDSGYHFVDDSKFMRVSYTKQPRANTLEQQWKQRITCSRHIIERVHKSLKRFKIIGGGRMLAADVDKLPDIMIVLAGWHNEFAGDYQQDTAFNDIRIKRIQQFQTIQKNPCDAYYVPEPQKPKKKQRNAEQGQAQNHQQGIPMQAQQEAEEEEEEEKEEEAHQDYDDHFIEIASGIENVARVLKEDPRFQFLRDFALKKEDVQDLMGTSFMFSLCRAYMSKMKRAFWIGIHKDNPHCIKIGKLCSRWGKSATRNCIFNFGTLKTAREEAAAARQQQQQQNQQQPQQPEQEEEQHQEAEAPRGPQQQEQNQQQPQQHELEEEQQERAMEIEEEEKQVIEDDDADDSDHDSDDDDDDILNDIITAGGEEFPFLAGMSRVQHNHDDSDYEPEEQEEEEEEAEKHHYHDASETCCKSCHDEQWLCMDHGRCPGCNSNWNHGCCRMCHDDDDFCIMHSVCPGCDDAAYDSDVQLDRRRNNPNHNQQAPAHDSDDDVPMLDQPQYNVIHDADQIKPLVETFWKDIDWSLWDTDLIRAQFRCDCPAGAAMAHPCAHVGCLLMLMVFIMNDSLEEVLRQTSRDTRIKAELMDCTGVVNWYRNHEKRIGLDLYCHCRRPWEGVMFKCQHCQEYFHEGCVRASYASLQKKGLLNRWRCHWCNEYTLYAKKLVEEGDTITEKHRDKQKRRKAAKLKKDKEKHARRKKRKQKRKKKRGNQANDASDSESPVEIDISEVPDLEHNVGEEPARKEYHYKDYF